MKQKHTTYHVILGFAAGRNAYELIERAAGFGGDLNDIISIGYRVTVAQPIDKLDDGTGVPEIFCDYEGKFVLCGEPIVRIAPCVPRFAKEAKNTLTYGKSDPRVDAVWQNA